MAGLRQILGQARGQGHLVGFPVEVRTAAPDDVWLSTAYGSPRVYIAVHEFYAHEHAPFFGPVEELFAQLGGRPHWGKMHTRTAADLAEAVPRFADFVAVRDRLDPTGVFANPYTEQVLPPPHRHP